MDYLNKSQCCENGKIFKKHHVLLWTLSLMVLLAPLSNIASAQSSNNPGGSVSNNPGSQSGSFQNPLSADTLAEFLKKLLEVIIDIGFPIVVLAIIWTGFLFVKAQGNPEELKTARAAFFWTLIGALLVLGAFVLSELIQATVNEIT